MLREEVALLQVGFFERRGRTAAAARGRKKCLFSVTVRPRPHLQKKSRRTVRSLCNCSSRSAHKLIRRSHSSTGEPRRSRSLSAHRHRCQWQGREGFRAQAVQGSELTAR